MKKETTIEVQGVQVQLVFAPVDDIKTASFVQDLLKRVYVRRVTA